MKRLWISEEFAELAISLDDEACGKLLKSKVMKWKNRVINRLLTGYEQVINNSEKYQKSINLVSEKYQISIKNDTAQKSEKENKEKVLQKENKEKEKKELTPLLHSPLEGENQGEIFDVPHKKKVFKAPTIEEIQAYLDEAEIVSVEAEAFHDFYESKGWMVGRTKMKDWKAAVRTWDRTQKEKQKPKIWRNPNLIGRTYTNCMTAEEYKKEYGF